jgi:hypothetical protein
MGGHLERAAVGEHAGPTVDGPHGARFGGGERCQLERVRMAVHDEVVVEAELTLQDPDVRGGPLQQLDHERSRLVQAPAVGEVDAGEGLSRSGHVLAPSSGRSIPPPSDPIRGSRNPRRSVEGSCQARATKPLSLG